MEDMTAGRVVARVRDRYDVSGAGVLDIKASQGADLFRLFKERGVRKLAFLASYMGNKGDIAGLVDRRATGTGGPGVIKKTASWRSVARADDAGDMPARIRLEDPHSQSNVRLAGKVNALVCLHNARKDEIPAIVQPGVKGHSLKLSARRAVRVEGHDTEGQSALV